MVFSTGIGHSISELQGGIPPPVVGGRFGGAGEPASFRQRAIVWRMAHGAWRSPGHSLLRLDCRDANGKASIVATRIAYSETVADARSPQGWRGILKWFSPSAGVAGSIPSLDGLRAMAVLMVMSFHAYHPDNSPMYMRTPFDIFRYGYTGVQLFFVLSGFLLFLPYARWLIGAQSHPSTRLFYERRILRVGPAYWVNIAILLLTSKWSLRRFESGLAHAAFLHNVFFDPMARLNGVLWTMAVEVQFYAVLPLLAWAMYWIARMLYVMTHRVRFTFVAACFVVIAGCEALSVLCQWLIATKRWTSIPIVSRWPDALVNANSLPYWLGIFVFGMTCSLIYVSITSARQRKSTGSQEQRILATIIGLLGVGLAFGLALAPLAGAHVMFLDSFFGLFFGLIVLGLLFGMKAFRWLFEFPALRFIGHISYSLYLWHLVVLMAIEPHLKAIHDPRQHMLMGFLIDFGISIPVAYVSFLITERPFFSLRRRAREKPAVAGAPMASNQQSALARQAIR